MKQTICFLAILVQLSACNSGEQKSGNNQPQITDTTAAETTMEKPVDITYTQCPLAYLIDGELYFYNIDENKKVKFAEESDTIFNFTIDTEAKTLHYSV